jgi:spore photoproduct lyase
LAGTPGVWRSPTVKIFVNLPEILTEIEKQAARFDRPTAFYHGKLQDGLALDPLTGYSRRLVPFFAQRPCARMTLLTKSTDVENLLDLDHRGRSILSWTVNPPELVRAFETNTPPVSARIEAMRRVSAAGYPVRAVMMPILPLDDWRSSYAWFLEGLLARVRLQRITLGSICSYPMAVRLMERKLGRGNFISRTLEHRRPKGGDGRARFPEPVRVEAYRFLIDTIRRIDPGLEIGLCLEDPGMFQRLGMQASVGRCNCVL